MSNLQRLSRRLAKRLPLQPLRVARLRRNAKKVLFDWSGVLERGCDGRSFDAIRAAVEADEGAPRVLMATTVGGHLMAIQFDALMAVALTLRGARVSFLLCDAALPACMVDQHDWYPDRKRLTEAEGPRAVCQACHPVGESYLGPLGLPIHRLSNLVSPDERRDAVRLAGSVALRDAKSWRHDGLPLGEHALAGALRFHARADLDGVPDGEAVFRAYLKAALVSQAAARRLRQVDPSDVLVAHHGIYIPQGIWVAAARQAGQRVVTWNPAYRRGTFVLSQDDTYHHTMITEDLSTWRDTPLTLAQRDRLHRYLRARREGAQDWISFGTARDTSFRAVMERLGLDAKKPTIGLLTSVTWDAQLHYESNAFSNQLEWVDATIETFAARESVNLVLRIHPAELTGNIPSEQRIADHIKARFPVLPRNVVVVRPDDDINTYALMDGCDSVLIYSTKTGIELAAGGKPVVVAGEAWIRGKGFSRDAASPADYRRILAELPFGRPLNNVEQELAERYAFHLFFRRMIELPGFVRRKGWPPYRSEVDRLEQIKRGADENLDVVCDSILSGAPFHAVS